MTIASGMRPRRLRLPTALADGGTGARTAPESRSALGVPGLTDDNYWTGMNTFDGRFLVATVQAISDLTLLTTDTVTLTGGTGSAVFDLTALTGSRVLTAPNASGTLALLSDITGGSGNGVVATVDFGSSFTPYASVVVTGQTWVAAGSKIAVTPKASTGTEVEVAVLAFSCVVSDLVAGVGFTLNVFTPVEAKGTYNFSCVGV